MIVQATGNNQLGGVKLGLTSDWYHSPGLNSTPVLAAAAQARRKMKKVMVMIGPCVGVFETWTGDAPLKVHGVQGEKNHVPPRRPDRLPYAAGSRTGLIGNSKRRNGRQSKLPSQL
ncbi:hypothetical protein D3C73_1254310 [compost metagenome]